MREAHNETKKIPSPTTDLRFLVVIASLWVSLFSCLHGDTLFQHHNTAIEVSAPANTPLALREDDKGQMYMAKAIEQRAGNNKTVVPGNTPFYFLPVPINSADKKLLMTVQGVGPVLGERIIAYREKHGRIKNQQTLLQVRGVGEKKLQKLQGKFSFEVK